ncbi:MAG: hypothetical protein IPI95_15090 [Flavobacteriales bacterium]|nr:hypothetical protein [Flavobacteriales bacterium]
MKRTLLALTLTLPMLLSAQLNPVRIALHNWATGLNRPVWLANAGDDRLFVVQQGGIIKIITDSMQVMSTPFLNITSAVNSNGNEQGLLGLAFDPNMPLTAISTCTTFLEVGTVPAGSPGSM